MSEDFVKKVLNSTPLEDSDIKEEPTKEEVTPVAASALATGPEVTETKVEAPATQTEVKRTLVSKEAIESAGKVKTATIARLIVLVLTLINQILATLGFYANIPINQSVIEVISLVLVVAAALYCYWKNNSWSVAASIGDNVMDALKDGEISISDIFEIIADATKRDDSTETDTDNNDK